MAGKAQIPGPPPQFCLRRSGGSPKICISEESPGDTDEAGGPPFGTHRTPIGAKIPTLPPGDGPVSAQFEIGMFIVLRMLASVLRGWGQKKNRCRHSHRHVLHTKKISPV